MEEIQVETLNHDTQNDANDCNQNGQPTEGTEQEQQKEQPPMSKSQMKKLAKRQRWLARLPEIKRIEKEKRKLKRQKEAKLRDKRGETLAVDVKPKRKLMSESSNKFKVVIDMDFNDLMTDEEIAKAAKQVGRIYAYNRRCDNPCQLYVSSLKDKILDRFNITNTGYKNWDINISDKDYLDMFKYNDEGNKIKKSERREQFIYLSGDSDNTLPDVETILKDYQDKIFIIGGLVDHNRHKNLCQERAVERQIYTAKLPIKENVTLRDRHILTTVNVFEILLQLFAEHKSWQEALFATIPKRKLAPYDKQPKVGKLQLLDESKTLESTKTPDGKQENDDTIEQVEA